MLPDDAVGCLLCIAGASLPSSVSVFAELADPFPALCFCVDADESLESAEFGAVESVCRIGHGAYSLTLHKPVFAIEYTC